MRPGRQWASAVRPQITGVAQRSRWTDERCCWWGIRAEGTLDGLRIVLELPEALNAVVLEIWMPRSLTQPDVLQFVASARVDLVEWRRVGRPTRRYPLGGSDRQQPTGPDASCHPPAKEGEQSGLHIRVRSLEDKPCRTSEAAADVKAAAEASVPPSDQEGRDQSTRQASQSAGTFRFQMPATPVTRSRRFRDLRVGQIAREVCPTRCHACLEQQIES